MPESRAGRPSPGLHHCLSASLQTTRCSPMAPAPPALRAGSEPSSLLRDPIDPPPPHPQPSEPSSLLRTPSPSPARPALPLLGDPIAPPARPSPPTARGPRGPRHPCHPVGEAPRRPHCSAPCVGAWPLGAPHRPPPGLARRMDRQPFAEVPALSPGSSARCDRPRCHRHPSAASWAVAVGSAPRRPVPLISVPVPGSSLGEGASRTGSDGVPPMRGVSHPGHVPTAPRLLGGSCPVASCPSTHADTR